MKKAPISGEQHSRKPPANKHDFPALLSRAFSGRNNARKHTAYYISASRDTHDKAETVVTVQHRIPEKPFLVASLLEFIEFSPGDNRQTPNEGVNGKRGVKVGRGVECSGVRDGSKKVALVIGATSSKLFASGESEFSGGRRGTAPLPILGIFLSSKST